MKIIRIDSEKEINKEADRIWIEINEKRYELVEMHGGIRVYCEDKCFIHPCFDNVFYIFQKSKID